MIDEEGTLKRFGYRISDLKAKSGKPIIAKCDVCGKVRILSKHNYRTHCLSCAMKSESIRKKISKGHEGSKNGIYGKHRSEETRQKISDAEIGEKNHNFGKHPSKDTLKKLREARKHRRFPKHHTKPERIFEEICQRNSLDFHYVGDGSFWIGKKGEKQLNPDFIEANGKKICVEVMGDYWHSPLLNRNLREDSLLLFRKKHFRRFGWKTVFIWGTDLLRKDTEQFILKKLKNEKI
jgi:hypothetical protein